MNDLSGTYYSENDVLVFIKKNPESSFKEYSYQSPFGMFQVFDFTVEEFLAEDNVIRLDDFIED